MFTVKLKLVCIIFIFEIVTYASLATIDQIIINAAKSGSQLQFFDSVGNSSDMTMEYDMIFTNEQWAELVEANSSTFISRTKRKALRNVNQRWPGNVIPYVIAQGTFDDRDRMQIMSAMADWERFTCITFREATRRDSASIRFQDGQGCSSYVGMTRIEQAVTLASGCRRKKTIIHEIGHAIGFHHEQTRPDRDNFVRILSQNIPPGVLFNFEKYSTNYVNTFNVPYDYRSIMHYGGTAFSTNGKRTIQTKNASFQRVIGNAQELSFKDIKLANIMNSCAAKCDDDIECPDEGYLSKECKCMCPSDMNIVKLCDVSTIVTPVSPDCTDMMDSCDLFKENGECTNFKDIMMIYCRKACNFCDVDVMDCMDMNRNCPYWQKQDYCTRGMFQVFMKDNCPVACGLCQSLPPIAEGSGSSQIVATLYIIFALIVMTTWL